MELEVTLDEILELKKSGTEISNIRISVPDNVTDNLIKSDVVEDEDRENAEQDTETPVEKATSVERMISDLIKLTNNIYIEIGRMSTTDQIEAFGYEIDPFEIRNAVADLGNMLKQTMMKKAKTVEKALGSDYYVRQFDDIINSLYETEQELYHEQEFDNGSQRSRFFDNVINLIGKATNNVIQAQSKMKSGGSQYITRAKTVKKAQPPARTYGAVKRQGANAMASLNNFRFAIIPFESSLFSEENSLSTYVDEMIGTVENMERQISEDLKFIESRDRAGAF